MYLKSIPFDSKLPVVLNTYHIDQSPLHCHEDAIEIIFVLQGEVKLKVSFEHFTLSEGDYVVVNREDSHKIWRQGEADNMVAIFHISLKHYLASFSHIYYILFACESFDLAKYKGQSCQLRQLLFRLTDSLLQQEANAGKKAKNLTDKLMQALVTDYSLERYYNRHREIGPDKLEKYYTIIQYMYEKYPNKTLLEDISRQEFYSRSYISHLFKEVGAASFQDMLGYIRVYKAERLLLETDETLTAISGQCGFSDIKYFNRTFQKWFLIKPAEYRKIYQQQTGTNCRLTKVVTGKIAERIQYFTNLPEANIEKQSEYKVSMTPITLKNIGSKTDLLSYLKQDRHLTETGDSNGRELAENTYAVIRVNDNGDSEYNRRLLEELLNDFQKKASGYVECWFIK